MSIDFQALAAPIPANEIKTRPGRGKSGDLSYITSRTVMNRLDRVVGPANWRDEYTETQRGVVCALYIYIDGEWVGKSDIGVESNIEGDKGSYSDAFKRAAVKWGIGRELYHEGTAYDDAPPAAQGNGKPPVKRKQSPLPQPIDKAKLWEYAQGLGYTEGDQILRVLKVDAIENYSGTKEQAANLLKEHAPKAAA